mmetsp:Transcript_134721/g.327479  ORF Transcript_134721/g.327479 Transcript_134721/m.327479 type:complete len:231 (-) Transcript_134721:32-724(-)
MTWFVREWCTACERCHEKYGTSSAECRTYPTTSCTNLFSENAPWPHSCATTQHPVAAVPATNAYAIHAGMNASVIGRYAYAASPSPTVIAVDTAAYRSDLPVSFTKQRFGIFERTSAMVGNSDGGGAFSALPFMPLKYRCSVEEGSSAAIVAAVEPPTAVGSATATRPGAGRNVADAETTRALLTAAAAKIETMSEEERARSGISAGGAKRALDVLEESLRAKDRGQSAV